MSTARKICPICSQETCKTPDPRFATCEAYADQDYVYQRELNLAPVKMDQFHSALSGKSQTTPWYNSQRPKDTPSLEEMLDKAPITEQQRDILKMYFQERRSFFSISQVMGISKQSVHRSYVLAIKKLKKGVTNFLWVEGENKFASLPAHFASLSKQRKQQKQRQKLHRIRLPHKNIDPYDHYSICPKCSHHDMQGKEGMGLCLGCGWTFTVED